MARDARQAEAERERRAKVINAEGGSLVAAERLKQAAEIMTPYPMATADASAPLTEVATENNSTIVFPLPLELLTPFLNARKGEGTPQQS